MAIKPILFNTEMVRAILDGRKTCTRRVIKPQPQSRLCYTYAGSHKSCIGKWTYPNKGAHEFWGEEYKLPENITDEELSKRWNPPYHTDDILYVRETWCGWYLPLVGMHYCYRATEPDGNKRPTSQEYDCDMEKISWHPSIHMPKEAARIWLNVTDVRVERLQAITEDGAKADGMPDSLDYPVDKEYCPLCKGEGIIGTVDVHSLGHMDVDCPYCDSYRKRFENLWNSINQKHLDRYGWDENPWVWVIEFERCEKPKEV
ncbi:MAG: hypothetical protein SOX45_11255 [Lachnospiraceae bacterium]|nr:hypothetical protein [Lachnospiraceae bacterium]